MKPFNFEAPGQVYASTYEETQRKLERFLEVISVSSTSASGWQITELRRQSREAYSRTLRGFSLSEVPPNQLKIAMYFLVTALAVARESKGLDDVRTLDVLQVHLITRHQSLANLTRGSEKEERDKLTEVRKGCGQDVAGDVPEIFGSRSYRGVGLAPGKQQETGGGESEKEHAPPAEADSADDQNSKSAVE